MFSFYNELLPEAIFDFLYVYKVYLYDKEFYP